MEYCAEAEFAHHIQLTRTNKELCSLGCHLNLEMQNVYLAPLKSVPFTIKLFHEKNDCKILISTGSPKFITLLTSRAQSLSAGFYCDWASGTKAAIQSPGVWTVPASTCHRETHYQERCLRSYHGSEEILGKSSYSCKRLTALHYQTRKSLQ